MPTPARSSVAAARAAALARLEKAGQGGVVSYPDVARDVEAACPALSPKRARHALRKAVDEMSGEGLAEPWGRRLRDGRWVVTWLRAPGRAEPPEPKARLKWRPAVPYKGRFHVAPELLAKVEAVVLELLEPPHCPRELLAAAHPRPLPGPGWVPAYFLSCRVGLHVALTASTRLNVLGAALRSLARKGLVSLLAQPMRSCRRRVRWCRLAPAAAPPLQSGALALPLGPRGRVSPPEPPRA